MSTNIEILRNKMVENQVNVEKMAKVLGIDGSTFYRKLKTNGDSFTVGQMHKIAEVLQLSRDEAASIFLW